MIDNSLGGLSSEIVCMITKASTNKTIRYSEDEWHTKDDGRFGKIIEDLYIESGGVHGRCEADIKGCEIKSKNLASKSNDIKIAEFYRPINADGVNMIYQAYNKIKDSLLFAEYVVPESGAIIVKRITFFQDLPWPKFKSFVKMRDMNFDINKNKLKKMYKKTTVIFDDLEA